MTTIPQLLDQIRETLNIQLHVKALPEGGYMLVESTVVTRDLFVGSLAEVKTYLMDLCIVEGELQRGD